MYTFTQWLERLLAPVVAGRSQSMPTDANAINLFRGRWISRIPLDNVKTGDIQLFTGDGRPAWAARALGGFEGASILELGPMEAGHTFQLEQLGAGRVVAIESNKDLFLRCLVVKNVLGLSAKFLLGNFLEYLRDTQDQYDVIFASGVLYHMADPVELIKLIAQHCSKVYLWTHYFDEQVVRGSAKMRLNFVLDRSEQRQRHGFAATYHRRNYGARWMRAARFIGGVRPYSVWMEKPEIIDCLNHFGMEVVALDDIRDDHPNGPSLSIAAIRS